MDRLNILFLTIEVAATTKSGAGIYALELIHALVKKGVKVVVIAPGKSFKIEKISDNLIYYWINTINKPLIRIPSFYFNLSRKIDEIIKKEKIDIIHNNEYAGFSALGRKPLLTTIHHPAIMDFKNFGIINKIFNLSDQLLEKNILKKSDLVFADSHLTYELLKKHTYLFNKLYLMNVGVDTNRFRYTNNSIRKDYGISDKEVLLFHPGGARSRRKGSLYLFSALKRLKKIRSFKCIISGESREIGWVNIFKQAIIENELSANIILSGEIRYDLLKNYYSAADIVLIPSTFEGFGIPLLESLACDAATIATATGEASNIIKNYENAILISPNNDREIYSSIMELLNNKNLKNKIKSNARKSILGKYDWNYIADKTIEYYRVLKNYEADTP